MSRITHWRLYCSIPIGEAGENFVELSEFQAEQIQKLMVGHTGALHPVVTGREPNVRDSRTIYVHPNQIVALEPRED